MPRYTLDYQLSHPLHAEGVKKYIDALAVDPSDSLLRLDFADHLTDLGYHRAAAGQKWAATHGKYPSSIAGWSVTHGYEGKEGDKHNLLPTAFSTPHDYDTNSVVHPVTYRRPDDDRGTWLNEHDFLDASHQLDWHPKSGEPMPKD